MKKKKKKKKKKKNVDNGQRASRTATCLASTLCSHGRNSLIYPAQNSHSLLGVVAKCPRQRRLSSSTHCSPARLRQTVLRRIFASCRSIATAGACANATL